MRSRWLILALVVLAQLMVVLDATIVNIALPSAQADARLLERLAAVDRDRLRARVRQPAPARRPARRRLRAQADPGPRAHSASRVPRRSAAPPRASSGCSRRGCCRARSARCSPRRHSRLLTTTFTEPRDRNKAFGIFGAVIGSGAAVGLLLGGALTEYLSWRWCLYVNLFLALPVTVGALDARAGATGAAQAQPRPARCCDGGRRSVPDRLRLRPRPDRGLERAADDRLARGRGRCCSRFFVLIEARSRHPLLPLRLLENRARGRLYLAVLFTGTGTLRRLPLRHVLPAAGTSATAR